MAVIIREKENCTEVGGLSTGLLYRATREGGKVQVTEVFTPDAVDCMVTVYENRSLKSFSPRTNGGGIFPIDKARKLAYDLLEVAEICEVLNNL